MMKLSSLCVYPLWALLACLLIFASTGHDLLGEDYRRWVALVVVAIIGLIIKVIISSSPDDKNEERR